MSSIKIHKLLFLIFLSINLISCNAIKNKTNVINNSANAPLDTEFRGVWVATVDNIDWPSKPGLSTAMQQQEALNILDRMQDLNMNAIIFQIRPAADAFYQSKIEPWSYFLTKNEGQAPNPFYDPLQFWIQEAHKRGLELHAWFNPYRAYVVNDGGISVNSIVKRHPEYVVKLANGNYWLNPTMQEVQDYSFSVVADVLARYDVDGIHFDDYFYPYGDGSFADDKQWNDYRKKGGKLSRGDWRRDNVNKFVYRIYQHIKASKKAVKFSISPFGIWQPGYPNGIEAGIDQYHQLYADPKLWLNKGWVDFMVPQLYWPISQIPQSYPILLNWWQSENTLKRHIFPGLYTTRQLEAKEGVIENINQIMVSRGFNSLGHVHFSAKTLMKNDYDFNNILKTKVYKAKALPF